ncbi:CPBP family intramembrane glutamic endopeptidase [Pseudoalteromonas sp. T1lg23B]|uniref:CPBP family intramembrane glutamic endopeptidase n=1 Tax=Pseudoalteromonas sp. T1lg23B TaxID=2077097 RepID=UPI000CF6A130|nr:CPBP family intramembrane glutamic endopeptidase [Pseudoalteromonas sp. T1lg23B]
MFHIPELIESTAFALLLASLLSAFVSQRISLVLFLITLMVAFFGSIVTFPALLALAIIMSLAYLTHHIDTAKFRYPVTALTLLACIALAAHQVPGFNNLLVLEQVQKSSNSLPFDLYFNFDKSAVLFVLLLLYPALLHNGSPLITVSEQHKAKLTALFMVLFFLVLASAWSLELIMLHLHLPGWWWLFALNNLVVTCVIEEAFFRGYIQQKLSARLNPYYALIISSLLFGLAHFSGPLEYMLVASVAGGLYGAVYAFTGKLYWAVICHFLINFVHLALFTYPMVHHS